MVRRALVIAIAVAGCGGGGNNSGPHGVTVDVVGPGSVSSTPAGIDCPSAACTSTFTDHVTLFAQPDNGAVFAGWSGGCTGTDQSCELQLSSDQHLTAMFQASTGDQMLTVSVTGPGTITATNISCPGGACSASYPSGTMVTLTEAAAQGAAFTGWGGDCGGTGACTVTMDQARNVSATFAGQAGMYMLSVTVNGIGTVTSTPSGIACSSGTCTSMFASSTNVSLQESAQGGTFTGWGGDCGGNGNCTVTMSQDRAVTATFGSSGYVMTVHLAGDGTGTVTSNPAGINCTTGSPTGCSYDFGVGVASVSLTATPATGSTYAGQGSMGNVGCNGDNYGNSCSYGLSPSGTTVDVSFSAWDGQFEFPATLTGLVLVGTTYVAVGGGGNAITSSNDSTGGNGLYWTGRHAPAALNALAAQGSAVYAPRDGGHVAATSDGITWTDYAAGTSDLEGIASSGTMLVAAGKAGAIEYSANGTSWTAASSGVAYDLLAATYANGQFVAIGFGGTIVTSPDGIEWTARTSGVTSVLWGITYGNSKYVVVGAGGIVLTSTDGITWTKPATTGLPVAVLRGIATIGTTYVAAGDPKDMNNTTAVFTSPDATTWTQHGSATFGEPTLRLVTPGDGFIYMLGSNGSLARSSNGTTWSPVLSPGARVAPGQGMTTTLDGIAYSGTTYVAVGQYGSIFTSPDGAVWTSRRTSVCCGGLVGVAWGAGLGTPVFAAAGNTGTSLYVLTSPDGITWTQAFPTSGTVTTYAVGIAYGGSTKGFAVVGSSFSGSSYVGYAVTSADGITWTPSPNAGTELTSQLSSFAYGGGLFVTSGLTTANGNVNGDGTIFTSPDGASWTQQAVVSDLPLGPVAYGNGTWVALAPEKPAVFTSSNGINWTSTALAHTPGPFLAFGNGMFLDSSLYTSTDGTTWTQQSALPDLQEINGGVFTAALYDGAHWLGVSTYELFVTHP